LLWVGWIVGGVFAYTISRYLGRPVVKALGPGPAFERYENRISRHASFGLVLLFQLAVPSEVPGYLLGLAGYKFWKYLVALALAELPYAVATIYLGASFLERRMYQLAGVGLAAAAFSGWALYTLHRRITAKPT
ncbi:MAG TPA: VTT domain-containing protein, partial [Candidatus Glassbacteria bacterium]|nr:VTT domain-containing protein [Candidatus Glassbacteria bacterium]